MQQNQVIVNMGTHQKEIIGNMKERKMQMRAIGENINQPNGSPDSNNFSNTISNFIDTYIVVSVENCFFCIKQLVTSCILY